MKYLFKIKDYAWNPNICACEYDKHFEVRWYLTNCFCVKLLFGNLVITWNKIVDTTDTPIYSIDKKVT